MMMWGDSKGDRGRRRGDSSRWAGAVIRRTIGIRRTKGRSSYAEAAIRDYFTVLGGTALAGTIGVLLGGKHSLVHY